MTGTLTIHDNNTTVEAKVGHPIHIVLAGNPTTGYAWTRAGYEKKEKLSDDDLTVTAEYKAAANAGGVVGAGGNYHISVTPKTAGRHTLSLVYARSFEGANPDNKSYTLYLSCA